jgi:uroporphyrinogen-III synthase
LNTREEGIDGPLMRALDLVGLESLACPMIAIAPPVDPAPFVEAVGRLTEFEWVAFTSGHAIEAISQRPEWRSAVQRGSVPYVAAVGEASAERLAADGIAVRVVPDGVGASSLANAMLRSAGTLEGVRVLWPRGDRALAAFREALERGGAVVTSPIAYRALPPSAESVSALAAALDSNRVAAIAFCSPSSAQNLAQGLGFDRLSSLRDRVPVVASIGPTTTAALRALRLDPDVEANDPSMTSLAEAIAACVRVAAGGRL